MGRSASAVVVALGVFLASGCGRAANLNDQRSAASALVNQFETIFFAKGDLLSGSGGYAGLSLEVADTLRAPFVYLLYGLDALSKSASSEVLGSTGAALVGAKDFRPPTGPPPHLGDVQSTFCYVLILKSRSTFDFSAIASTSASSVEASIWKWSAAGTEGHPEPHQFFGTQVGNSYVVISNDLDDLRQMSARLSSNASVLNPSGIRDWETISQHDMWGYRAYRHNEENKVAAGTLEVTPDTEALAFFFDPQQKAGVLRLFSPTAGTADKMNAPHLLAPLKATGVGAWETVVPLTDGLKTTDQMFAVMSWFGFGVYI